MTIRMERVERNNDELHDRSDRLLLAMEKGFSEMRSEFSAMRSEFAQIRSEFAQMSERFNKLENDLSGWQKHIIMLQSAISETFTGVERRLDRIENHLGLDNSLNDK